MNRAFKKSRAEDGFTLLELLIVIVIIGILAAIAVPVFLNQQKAAINATVKSDVRNTTANVILAINKVPTATGFVVYGPGDTLATTKMVGVPSKVVTVPAGQAAVEAVRSRNNVIVINGSVAAGYEVIGCNPDTLFGWKFISNTGLFADALNCNSIISASGSGSSPNQFVNLTTTFGDSTTVRQWSVMASSADGSKLVAATAYSAGQIFTSTDSGATMTLRSGAGARNWSSVASDSSGSKLLAADAYGYVYQSTDSGLTWAANTALGAGNSWTRVASSADGTKLFAATGWKGGIYVSLDSGATWSLRIIPPEVAGYPSNIYGIADMAVSSDGKNIYVTGNYQLMASHDSGLTWIYTSNNIDISRVAVSGDGNVVVTTGSNGGVIVSTDSGVTWKPSPQVHGFMWAVAANSDGSKLVLTYVDGAYTSTDSGTTWTLRSDIQTSGFTVTTTADGKKIIGAPWNRPIYTMTYTPAA